MLKKNVDLTTELARDTNRCSECHNRTGFDGLDCRRHVAATPATKESK